jgi:hypothetical protein
MHQDMCNYQATRTSRIKLIAATQQAADDMKHGSKSRIVLPWHNRLDCNEAMVPMTCDVLVKTYVKWDGKVQKRGRRMREQSRTLTLIAVR